MRLRRQLGDGAEEPRALHASNLTALEKHVLPPTAYPHLAALTDLQQPPTLKSFATDHTYLLSLWPASSSGRTMVNRNGSDVNANGCRLAAARLTVEKCTDGVGIKAHVLPELDVRKALGAA